jgi:hypothetical protein
MEDQHRFPPIVIVQSQRNFSALLISGAFAVLLSLGWLLNQARQYEVDYKRAMHFLSHLYISHAGVRL